jgi:hypothetical protein
MDCFEKCGCDCSNPRCRDDSDEDIDDDDYSDDDEVTA